MADNKTTENLIGCTLGLLLIPFMIALRGWVLATLWRWLMVPIFGTTALTVWQAIGVSVIIGTFTMRIPNKDDESALEGVVRGLIYILLSYSLALALGWIVAHQI